MFGQILNRLKWNKRNSNLNCATQPWIRCQMFIGEIEANAFEMCIRFLGRKAMGSNELISTSHAHEMWMREKEREKENGREKMKHLWPNLITWTNIAMFPFDHDKLKPVCDEYKFDFRKNSIQNAAKQFDIQLKSLFYPIQHFTWWLMWSNCDRWSTCHRWCRHH